MRPFIDIFVSYFFLVLCSSLLASDHLLRRPDKWNIFTKTITWPKSHSHPWRLTIYISHKGSATCKLYLQPTWKNYSERDPVQISQTFCFFFITFYVLYSTVLIYRVLPPGCCPRKQHNEHTTITRSLLPVQDLTFIGSNMRLKDFLQNKANLQDGLHTVSLHMVFCLEAVWKNKYTTRFYQIYKVGRLLSDLLMFPLLLQ